MQRNVPLRLGPTLARTACLTAAATALLAASPTLAQETPKGFQCTFQSGTSTAYGNGRFVSHKAKPLAFGIADIDLDGQKATLLTNGGKNALRIVRAVNANHFLEVVTEGFLNITTIYDKDPRKGAWPAVHSRHLGILGQPLVAQYTGFCTPVP